MRMLVGGLGSRMTERGGDWKRELVVVFQTKFPQIEFCSEGALCLGLCEDVLLNINRIIT
jgi:hypothetical protein